MLWPSKYLENLNHDQSYRSVKIEKSRRVVESRPVCLYGPSCKRLRHSHNYTVCSLGPP